MHRIIEAFTRPHYQETAIDQIIQTVILLGVIVLGYALVIIVLKKLDLW